MVNIGKKKKQGHNGTGDTQDESDEAWLGKQFMGPPLWPSPELHAVPGLKNRRILSGRREQAGNRKQRPHKVPGVVSTVPSQFGGVHSSPDPGPPTPQFQACLLPAPCLSSTGVTTAPSAWWSLAPTPFPTPVPGPTSTWRCSTTVSPTVSHLVPHADTGPSPFQKRVRRRHLEHTHTHTHTHTGPSRGQAHGGTAGPAPSLTHSLHPDTLVHTGVCPTHTHTLTDSVPIHWAPSPTLVTLACSPCFFACPWLIYTLQGHTHVLHLAHLYLSSPLPGP